MIDDSKVDSSGLLHGSSFTCFGTWRRGNANNCVARVFRSYNRPQEARKLPKIPKIRTLDDDHVIIIVNGFWYVSVSILSSDVTGVFLHLALSQK